MRVTPIAFVALAGLWLPSAAARAADPVPPAATAPVPYDAPASPAPVLTPAPPAVDAEGPHEHAPTPRAVRAAPEEDIPGPPEPGRIVGELAAGIAAANVGLILTGVTSVAGPLALGVFAATPTLTGGIVCAVGGSSDWYQGSCGMAIGGAYLGSLALIPGAIIGLQLDHSTGELAGLAGLVIGAYVGYVVGSTVGAVVGWNASRIPKARPLGHAARGDLLALSPTPPWTEPLRRRGGPDAGAPPTLSLPLLSFRF